MDISLIESYFHCCKNIKHLLLISIPLRWSCDNSDLPDPDNGEDEEEMLIEAIAHLDKEGYLN